jgi:hypothetical protein
MRDGDPLNERQPETGPTLTTREERREDLRLQLRRDPGAVVGDLESDLP